MTQLVTPLVPTVPMIQCTLGAHMAAALNFVNASRPAEILAATDVAQELASVYKIPMPDYSTDEKDEALLLAGHRRYVRTFEMDFARSFQRA